MPTTAKNTFVITWEIENFNFCQLENGEVLESPIFTAKILQATSWYLEIGIDKSKKYISCFLIRTGCLIEDISIRFSLELKRDEEDFETSLDQLITFSKKRSTWCSEEFCEIDELKNATGSITILCIMALDESVANITCNGRTKIAVDRSCFRWNIVEIESFRRASKIFPCSSSAHMEVVLTASEDEDLVNISIKKVGIINPASKYVSCKISLLDLKDAKRDSRSSEYTFKSDDENDIWQFPNFLQKSNLLDVKNKYLKNGTFTLMFEFCFFKDKFYFLEEYDNDKLISVYSGTKKDTLSVLHEDLKRMFDNYLPTDVSLQAENQIFQAHKCLLAARSPVFAAMFRQDMLENKTRVVDILDVDAKVLECFLKFMYTGTVDDLVYESASKLLIVADKYEVLCLKEKCASFLMLNLSITNVCEVVCLANMVSDEALKDYSLDYIAAHADVVLISEDWSRCIQNDNKLASEMFHKLSISVATK